MNHNSFFTKTIFALFTILFFQNFAIGQCPPEASSAQNSTSVFVDTGVYGGGGFPAIFINCTAEVNSAAATIDVEYQGVTTTFTKGPGITVTALGNCRVEYANTAADPTITTPFAITFSDNTSEACTYAQGGALPVEISKFDVDLVDDVVVLEWETVEELNNDYFEIFRSPDAKSWESIATINGAGTTLQTVRYSYEDEKPSIGKNYYMLAQYDYDGSMQLQELKVITLKGERNNIKLYPNPSSNYLTVEVWEDSNFPLEVNIFDATGKLVAVRQLVDYKQILNIDELDKGFYYLQVNTEHESISKRFVKQ